MAGFLKWMFEPFFSDRSKWTEVSADGRIVESDASKEFGLMISESLGFVRKLLPIGLIAGIIIGLILAVVLFPLILEIAAGIFIAYYAILFMTALVGKMQGRRDNK